MTKRNRRPAPPDAMRQAASADANENESDARAVVPVAGALPLGAAVALSERDELLRPISSGCLLVKVDDPLWNVVLRRSWVEAFADGASPLLRWRRVAFVEQLAEYLPTHRAAMVCVEYTQRDARRILDLLIALRRQFPATRCVVVGSRRWASREWGLRQAGATLCCWSPRQAGALAGLWLRHARLSPVLKLSPWKKVAQRMPWPPPEVAGCKRAQGENERSDGPPSAGSNE